MGVNDNAGCLDDRGVWAFIASKLGAYGGSAVNTEFVPNNDQT
jgi:hypothetical protein